MEEMSVLEKSIQALSEEELKANLVEFKEINRRSQAISDGCLALEKEMRCSFGRLADEADERWGKGAGDGIRWSESKEKKEF